MKISGGNAIILGAFAAWPFLYMLLLMGNMVAMPVFWYLYIWQVPDDGTLQAAAPGSGTAGASPDQ